MEERRKHQKGKARTKRAEIRRESRQFKQNKAGMLCVSGIVLVLLIAMSTQIVKLHRENKELDKELQQLLVQKEEELERQESIRVYEAYVTDPEYIEQIAKTKLGLAYSNEIIFKEKKSE